MTCNSTEGLKMTFEMALICQCNIFTFSNSFECTVFILKVEESFDMNCPTLMTLKSIYKDIYYFFFLEIIDINYN